MEPFRYHVFVCDQQKPEGVPCCTARGAGQVLEALRREVNVRGLEDEVQVTTCGSLGLCENGPNLVVYPEGIWYSGVTPADVPEIVRSHFQEGTLAERLVRTDPAVLRAEILTNRFVWSGGRAGETPEDQDIRRYRPCVSVSLDLSQNPGYQWGLREQAIEIAPVR
ncbi:Putative ferredoxin 2Fe-2S protein (modular protein) [Candidatus Sulfopaludibacter sp. SbA4]|nr:Putative ferredoxin 2Fe-2S protein (modular protein) [Candidatus Sulfopaludibacter sp. SbA4]